MQNIGTNETSITAGACVPTPATATTSPSVYFVAESPGLGRA